MKKASWFDRYLVALIAVGLLVVCMLGCKTNPERRSDPPAPPPKVDARLITSNTTFGLKLFGELAKAQPKENVFISPASVAMALAMTYNGAAGDTQQAMAKALELGGMSARELNEANSALRTGLENPDPEVRLSIANSLWTRQGVSFIQDFLQANRTYYGAEVANLDFSAPSAARTINDWVSKKTEGKIPTIVDRFSPDIVLALVNAVYFEGRWTHAFSKSETKDLPFTLLDGSEKKLPMMTRSGEYWHFKGDGLEAIRLPYSQEILAMYVFLPDRGTGLEGFCRSLTAQRWADMLSKLQESSGSITLPRFRVECGVKLNDALSALGMTVAFDKKRADFSRMCQPMGPVWIDEALHKTFVEVTEEGTKAAAATAVMGVAMAPPPPPSQPFNMVVDRPFLCAICDDETKTILFVGAIVDPGTVK